MEATAELLVEFGGCQLRPDQAIGDLQVIAIALLGQCLLKLPLRFLDPAIITGVLAR